MQNTKENIVAVVKENKIVCGVCGALLAKRIRNKMCTSVNVEEFQNLGTVIEIKCKHKDAGKVCNAINRVDL